MSDQFSNKTPTVTAPDENNVRTLRIGGRGKPSDNPGAAHDAPQALSLETLQGFIASIAQIDDAATNQNHPHKVTSQSSDTEDSGKPAARVASLASLAPPKDAGSPRSGLSFTGTDMKSAAGSEVASVAVFPGPGRTKPPPAE